MATLDRVPFKELQPVATDKSLRAVLEEAIAQFVDPFATAFDNPDDRATAYNVGARLIEIIDQDGMASDSFNHYVAEMLSAGYIRIGFYKSCRELWTQYKSSRENNR